MTPEPRKRPERESPELEAMIRRMLRALVRRATDGDTLALESLANLRADLAGAIAAAAVGAHDGPAEYSWTDIGQVLGVTRQAARQLYGGGSVRNGR